MDLLATALIGVVVILVVTLLTIRSILAVDVRVKGTTNIPGLNDGGRTWPIVGDAWRFIGAKDMKDVLDVFERNLSRCGKAVKVWIGPRLAIAVTDPKIAEVILNSSKSNDKDGMYDEFNKFSDGVFSRHGKRWSDLRRPLNKLVQPRNIVECFSKIFATKSEILCEVMEKKCGQGVFDVFDPITCWSLDVASDTLWGVPTNYLKKDDLKPGLDVEFLMRSVELSLKMILQVQYKVKWIYYVSALRKEVNTVGEKLTAVAKSFTEERRKILAASGINPEEPGFTPESYIDIVLQNNKREHLTGDRALTAILDFWIAAFDSSSVALSSVCLFLAMHPEYQEKAYKEQIEIMGDSLRAPTLEELDKMKYLWMVYMETLRHVGVPGVNRLINSSTEVDGLHFPEGATVHVSFHALQMNPKYWVKTKEFFPDNFLPEHVEKRPKGTFQPFSSGVRNCPGQRFAVTGGNMVLSTLLRRFSFTSPMKFDEMEYKYMLLIESVKGYPVEITRRNPAK